jgi:hypothetical protein
MRSHPLMLILLDFNGDYTLVSYMFHVHVDLDPYLGFVFFINFDFVNLCFMNLE